MGTCISFRHNYKFDDRFNCMAEKGYKILNKVVGYGCVKI